MILHIRVLWIWPLGWFLKRGPIFSLINVFSNIVIATRVFLYFPVSESIQNFLRIWLCVQNEKRNIRLGALLNWGSWAEALKSLAFIWHCQNYSYVSLRGCQSWLEWFFYEITVLNYLLIRNGVWKWTGHIFKPKKEKRTDELVR